MMTREQVESIKKHCANNGAIEVGSKQMLELCDMALGYLAMQPRPISEAPKDGTWLLGCWPNMGRWTYVVTRWLTDQRHEDGGYWEDQDGCANTVAPTTFIRLPSLPKAQP